MKAESIASNLQFLNGGGEMGALTRTKDWSQAPVGSPETWPQSLRTTLSIILNSKFPMFLWWGPELICFYNDAFRPSLGENGKHPSILGQRANEAWSEIWEIIKPLIDKVITHAEATWSEDQLIPIYRNGKMEDVYWTFSYSPVIDESGKPSGVLVTCYETTGKVKGLKDIKEREDQLSFTIDAAELGTWNLNPLTNRFIGNERLKQWFGLPPDGEIDLSKAISVIAERDRTKVLEAIENALKPGSGGHYNVEYAIKNLANAKERFVIAKGMALFDSNNHAYRFSGTLQDITEQVIARKKLEKSEKEFRNTVKQISLGITIFRGPHFIVEMANETYLQLVDKSEADFVGKPLFDSLPELADSIEALLTGVLTTGVPYYGTEFPVTLNRHGKKEQTYFNFAYHPFRDENDNIVGVIVVANEVTESVKAKHSLAESEKQFRNLVMQSPIPMTIFSSKDFVVEMANKVMFEKIWRKKETDIIGRKIIDAFPELKGQKYPELLKNVLTTGKPHMEDESIAYIQGQDEMKKFYLDFKYAPLYDIDNSVSGVIITVNDVTEKVEARQKVEEAEQRLRLAMEATEFATWDLDLQKKEIIYSSRLAEIFGHNKSRQLTHQDMRNQVHPEDLHVIVEEAFERALKSGIYYYEARILKPGDVLGWIRIQGKVMYDETDRSVKMIGTLQDITEDKYHQQELSEREQKFRLLADSMPQFVWTGDAAGNLNYFNQSVYDYSGLSPEQIMNDGWLQIVHPDDRQENIHRWINAVSTGTDFLFEHRFLRHDGEYRWQLSRAIPQKNAAGNIQMWVGTSTDIEEQKKFTGELENQVRERTIELEEKNRELERMNGELKSFAYVSSHDLQEPLRKIQTFASRIVEKESNNLSERGRDYFWRMKEAAKRMQTLIEDLLVYSRTSTSERTFQQTNLKELINDVINDFKESLVENNAVIELGPMCEANVIPFQFRQLMHNLISNSLKFLKPQEPLRICIKSEILAGNILKDLALTTQDNYCHIMVSDNGIGFDPQYKDRIFEVFQRLHGKDEYSGTGIGLSIVKKIVENHSGLITATGVVNQGASFDIYIPAYQARFLTVEERDR